MNLQMMAFFTVSVLHCWDTEATPVLVKSRQILQPLPGYIPVYIRAGNTPLEDINLDLAEAFESYALKQGRLSSARPLSDILSENEVKDENDISSGALNNIGLESALHEIKHQGVILSQRQHLNIQKIHKRT